MVSPLSRKISRLGLTTDPPCVKSIAVAMPRPSVRQADLERDALWLDLVEDGWTLSEIAEVTGYTRQRVHQRVQRARDTRAAEVDPQPVVGGEDAQWLELVSGPGPHPHPHYHLGTDRTSLDGTTEFVLVGTGRGGQPRRNRLGTGRHVDSGQRYRDDGDKLKGGVG